MKNTTKFFSIRKQVGIGRRHGVSKRGGVGFFKKGSYKQVARKRK